MKHGISPTTTKYDSRRCYSMRPIGRDAAGNPVVQAFDGTQYSCAQTGWRKINVQKR